MNEETGQDGRPIKVMVVDDSRTIRSTAEALLGKEGFTVLTAEDGFDALAKIAEDRPDIVFVDIMMPRLDNRMTGISRYFGLLLISVQVW